MITFRRLFAFSSVKPYDAAKDYYKILNVSQSAGADEIKKSYRNLAKKYHPDSNKGKEEQFKAINEAYQVLSDLQVKKQYDNIRFASRQSESQSSKSDYQRAQSSSQRSGFSQQQSNYRGYTEEQGWQNKSYRQQILHDLHQAHRRFTQENPRRATFHRSELNEEMMRKMAEQLKQQEQHIRKITRQEAERRERQYREYQDQTYQDVGQKAKEKLKEMAAGVAQTAQGFVKVGSFVKQLWDLFKKK